MLVLFTVFEVYSYLLRRLFLNRELLAKPCLFTYNEYNYYYCGARQRKAEIGRVLLSLDVGSFSTFFWATYDTSK